MKRLVFFGSPKVAVPFLDACASAPGWEVVAVVAQPDRPSGRGMKTHAPPVAEAAVRLGLPLRQPAKPGEILGELRQWKPDLCVVVAYGHLLKREVLDTAAQGFLNVHFSLLPKYRGAAPVQWSLVKGERKTGVTLFWIDEGMDTGPIQSVAQTDLPGDEDALSLFGRLSDIGAKLLSKTLADLAEDRVLREEQSGEPSKAPKIKPDFGRISFDMSAEELHNRVRGLRAGPGTFLLLENPKTEKSLRVKVLKTEFEEAESAAAPSDRTLPGAIVRVDPKKGILVQLSPGRLWFREVQPEGKKQQTSADFLNGLRLGAGDRLVAVP